MARPEPGKLWLIGCGNMAGAMLARWLESGLDPAAVTIVDPALPDFGVRTVAKLPEEPAPDRLLLGVKPQMLADVASGLQAAVQANTTLLSILAGVTHASLATCFPEARAVVRVMPNLPVRIGKGAVALFAPGLAREPLDALFAPLGLVEWIDDEGMFDAITALSGSGPAFLYRFAEALAQAGSAMGLDPQQADRFARATVEGAAGLAAASPDPLSALADRVASKGGSTRVGLDVLDNGAALFRLIEKTLKAAEARNRELGQ